MDKGIIVFGTTVFSEMMCYYIQRFTDKKVYAYCIDKDGIVETSKGDLNVVAFEEIEALYPPEFHEILLTIGYTKMNTTRKKKYNEIKQKGYTLAGFIHPYADIDTLVIGEGNIFLSQSTVGPYAKIGNSNVILNGCNISHHTTLGDFNWFAPSSTIAGDVEIGSNCFFGANSTVRDGVTVGDYTLLGAGTYLNESSHPHSVYVPQRSVLLSDKDSLTMQI